MDVYLDIGRGSSAWLNTGCGNLSYLSSDGYLVGNTVEIQVIGRDSEGNEYNDTAIGRIIR